MATLDARNLFPTSGAISEEEMIGRGSVVQDLCDRFMSGRDALIVEPRQVGKSSVLRAGVQKARRSGAIVAYTDLKVDVVQTSTHLGERLLSSARTEGGVGGLSAAGTRIQLHAAHTGEALLAPMDALGAAAQALGVPAEATKVITAMNDMLRRAGDLPFHEVLAILEADAQLRARSTVVVLDEVQDIAQWATDGEAVEHALASAARQPNRKLNFAFAGSENHALETLFAEGRPLRVVSDRFALPAIARDDWIAGLSDRFKRGGLSSSPEALDLLLEHSGGHPLATMYVAKESYLAAQAASDGSLDQVHVDTGLARGREQLWWSEFTGR